MSVNKAVCNSSPIIALSSIKSLNLLTELFDEIYIPEAVLSEVTKQTNSHLIGRIELLSMIEKNNINLYQVENTAAVQQLFGKLHFGELEVIITAKELNISSVILDDISARKLAETFFLNPVGTLGILLLAKQEGLVKVLKPLMDELISKNFRVSRKLYDQILKFVDE